MAVGQLQMPEAPVARHLPRPTRRESYPRANHRQTLGALGERLAAHHLQAKGYRIVDRNYRTREGEIDVIATDGKTLAFVEVKSRRGSRYGFAAEAITPRKAERLVSLAQLYSAGRPDLPENLRIDLVAIDFSGNGRLLSLEHFENAICEN